MSATTTTAPQRGNLRAVNTDNGNGAEGNENRAMFKTALEHVERVKLNLRNVIGDLAEVSSLLKTAEKEQRSSAKEIEAVRAKLREIQSVAI